MSERFCRARIGKEEVWARVDGDWLTPLDRPPWESAWPKADRVPLQAAELLVPTVPSKIVGVGQNYLSHARELNKPVPAEPLLFLKPPSALNPTGRPILLPKGSAEVHHEAELALVIGRRLHRASEAESAQGIFAVTCFNDVTARDIQRREVQHTRAKGYDTFACAGPWMVTGLSPGERRIVCRVNGQVRQEGHTSDMIFSPARLLSFISHVMTLLPGDLVTTGTPSGVGPLRAGDRVEVEIEGIGVLVNPVLVAAR